MLKLPETVLPVIEVVGPAAWTKEVRQARSRTSEKPQTRREFKSACDAGCPFNGGLLAGKVALPPKHRLLHGKERPILGVARRRSNRANWGYKYVEFRRLTYLDSPEKARSADCIPVGSGSWYHGDMEMNVTKEGGS